MMSNELPKKTFVNEDRLPNLCIINKDEEEKEKNMDEIDLNYDSLHQMTEVDINLELNEKLDSSILSRNAENHLDLNDSSVIVYSCEEVGDIDNGLNKDFDNISGNISDSSEDSTSSFELKISQMSSQDLLKVVKDIYHEKYLLEEENKSLHNELDCCKADNSPATYQANVEALEKDLAQAKADAFAWQNELTSTKEKFAQENINVRSDLTTRLERLMKQYEAANREKESMVVKYAVAEKDVLVVKKQKENIERKVKDLERDKEILQGKIKILNTEKSRTCGTLDNKIQELGIANRTIDKLRDEINAKDIKIKWGQNKLKSEIDSHKETQAKLDRALAKICNHEEEIKVTREEAEKVVKEAKEGENTRANILDKQLQETKALLIMKKQKYDDTSFLYKQLKSEHDSLQSTHILISSEVNTLKVHKYEQEREESEKLFQSLQSELKNLKQGKADLAEMLSHSAGYAEQLESERKKLRILEEEKKEFESKLEELTSDLARCKEKEGELLVFTQKLTDKNVTLQSQLTAAQGKVKLMEVDDKEMRTRVNELQIEVLKLTKELSQLKEEKKSQEESWSSMLQEKTKECSLLETKVSDLLNEIQVLQRKHGNSLKDSNREIQKLRKKLDSVESRQSSSHTQTSTPNILNGDNGACDVVNSWNRQDCLSQESRASSDISLHTVDSSQINGVTPSYSVRDPSANSPITDLPQQVLIDRIVRLQKSIIKKSEKCEFLEEHVSQLVGELKKKNKIIHHYIMREDAGALINSKSDENKAEIIKHGGIMASVYGSSPKDGTMTLELSLEINKKLQAVLEDTLLKNITLKENLNTLGDEVAKLALQNSKVP
ncbi:Coiled-coil domain-containing protein [Armadillidium nasatum]|uniref:Coiled-coil domain-containing protein n=1 Tax=Armadillidium nasatum TaxID=96803 RepID=A0A5N5SZD7_9CRUS|nr:Coiled-coil domain-containing protein [Armadillidium nasatum]